MYFVILTSVCHIIFDDFLITMSVNVLPKHLFLFFNFHFLQHLTLFMSASFFSLFVPFRAYHLLYNFPPWCKIVPLLARVSGCSSCNILYILRWSFFSIYLLVFLHVTPFSIAFGFFYWLEFHISFHIWLLRQFTLLSSPSLFSSFASSRSNITFYCLVFFSTWSNDSGFLFLCW